LDSKVHYKRYKSGKFWITALISVSFGIIGSLAVPQLCEAVPVYATSITDVSIKVGPNEFAQYFKLSGSASFYPKDSKTQVQLTPNFNDKAGAVALNTKIDMSQSFTLKGRLYLGDNPDGADGVAFGFADTNPGVLGRVGNAFGLGGLKNAFGVKFDVYYNGERRDGALPDAYRANQMNVIYTDPNQGDEVTSVEGGEGVTHAKIQGANGQYSELIVSYDGDNQIMTVTGSGATIKFNASRYIKNDQLSMFISGSTGGKTNQHLFDFESFTFTPGLDTVKENLTNDLTTTITAPKNAINQDPTLTTAQRQQLCDAIDQALQDGKFQIDQTTKTGDAIAAFDTAKAKINDIHKPGPSLADQKATQKQALKAKRDQIADVSYKDYALTMAETKQQTLAADQALADATAAVDAASDANGISRAAENGLKKIAAAYQPGVPLVDQKTAQKKALANAAASAKQTIQNDPTLTTTQRKKQFGLVDNAVTDGETAIDAANTADKINKALAVGKTSVNQVHQSGVPLADQKAAQKQTLKTKRDEIAKASTKDLTLTIQETNDQIAQADKALSAANTAIDAATEADVVNQAAADGLQQITAAYQPGAPLADQKAAQKKALKTERDRIADVSYNDYALTLAETKQQTSVADQALADASAAVDAAASADAINKAAASGLKQIAAAYQPGVPLADQRVRKKQALADTATKAKQFIQSDRTLTTAEKKTQLAGVDTKLADGEAAIDAANTADKINKAEATSASAILNVHQRGTDLADQKTARKQALKTERDKIADISFKDLTLTMAETTRQTDTADQALATAETAIDAANDADGIAQAADDGLQKITAAYQPGIPLADQRAAQKKMLATEAANAKQTIQADPTLTTAEKQTQLANVDTTLADGEASIDAVGNADKINKASAAAKAKINKVPQSGIAVADQKTAQKQALQAKRDKITDVINQDLTLTSDAMKHQISQADQAFSDATAAIDTAADADTINQAAENGLKTIAAAYQPGAPLADQKTTQKQALKAERDRIADVSNKDLTLTMTETNHQISIADQALTDASTIVDAAASADAINQATADGLQKIAAAYQPGVPLADQKTAQKKALANAAVNIKQAIQNDPTLTTAQKAQQATNVDTALADSETAVDAAKTADAINKAVAAGKTTISNAHQSGTAITDQKAAQKQALTVKHAEITDVINKDRTLTNKEMKRQLSHADQMLTDATAAIDAAVDADAINQVTDSGRKKITFAHQPGTPLADQKAAQKKMLVNATDKTKQSLQNDPTLTATQKQQQLTNLDAALATGEANIDAATSADTINTAAAAGQANIANAHQSGAAIAAQQAHQKQALRTKQADVIDRIIHDPTLTATEKKTQTALVDQALLTGKHAIDAAVTADAIQQAATVSQDNIDKAHQSGAAIDDQKAAQKTQLTTHAKQIEQAIKDAPTLTTAEKSTQLDAVAKALTSGLSTIDAAITADQINAATATGKNNIAAAYQVGLPLNTQKDDKKKQLNDTVTQAGQTIQADVTLTSAEKQHQLDKVARAAKTVGDAIDSAKTADAINAAFAAGKVAITNSYQTGTPLADQKNAQKQALANELAKVKQAIQADPTLTTADKQQQSDHAEAAKTTAATAINNAKSADTINAAFDAGKANLVTTHQPGAAIADQQAAKKQALDRELAKIKQAIQHDPTLTAAEKQQQTAAADNAGKIATTSLNAATTADTISAAFNGGQAAIKKTHQPGKAMDDQKAVQKQALDNAAAKVIQAIQGDATLTAAQKQQQTNAASKAAQTTAATIDAAKSADDIKAAFVAGQATVTKVHQSGSPIAAQQATHKQTLDHEATNTRQAIQHDATLTAAEKKQQAAAVTTANKAAQANIDAAKTADDINNTFTTGKTAIAQAHQPGKPVADQKTASKHSLASEVLKITQIIQNDPTLTATEKSQQANAAAKAGETAKTTIEAAKTADDINTAFAAGKMAIAKTHQPGTAIADQQAAQIQALAQAAAKTAQAIQADPTLTTAEKHQQTAAVANAQKTAQTTITGAKTADAINAATVTGRTAINNAHQIGTAIDQQQTTQMQALADKAATIKKAIQADVTLTAVEKRHQTAAINQIEKKAQAAIKVATTADEINTAVTTGTAAAAKVHQSGPSIDEQRTAQKKAISVVASKVKKTIQADSTLTTSEKQQQLTAVDKAVATALFAINAAKSADTTNAAFAAGKVAITNSYQTGTPLADQKTAMKRLLVSKVDRIKRSIENDATLTMVDKRQQTAAVDNIDHVIEAILTTAATADAVHTATTAGITNCTNAYQAGLSLTDQKVQRKRELDAVTAKAVQTIQADVTLTITEKKAQTDDVNKVTQIAVAAIDAARKADAINAAFAIGKIGINSTHRVGQPLESQKTHQKQAVANAATNAEQTIQSDPTLTAADKQQQIAAVGEAAKLAATAIDSATSADTIKTAATAGIIAINNVHQTGTPIADQKAAQQPAPDEATVPIDYQIIKGDTVLMVTEKSEQLNAIDQTTEQAETAIDTTLAADTINKSLATSETTMDQLHQLSTSSIFQEAPQEKVTQSDHDQVTERITYDTALTHQSRTSTKITLTSQQLSDKPLADKQRKPAETLDIETEAEKEQIKTSLVLISIQKDTEEYQIDREQPDQKTDITKSTEHHKTESETGKARIHSKLKRLPVQEAPELVNSTKPTNQATYLPQTGDNKSQGLAVLGALILGIVGVTTFGKKRKPM
jgi:LPXTG-motif cell wall-anchored protein